MELLVIKPSGPLRGQIRLPGDKSISHRAVIFASLTPGTTVIRNLLESEDVLRTVRIFEELGVFLRCLKSGDWIVKGKRSEELRAPRKILYCGNSGTTMRLMMGVLAALPFRSILTGDRSLNRRPMERVIEPLRRMGAKFHPFFIEGERHIEVVGGDLKGIHYNLPVPSAQVKSAILLAGRTAGVKVTVKEKIKTRDHTERMSRFFKRSPGRRRLIIPGDPSSAAFFTVAALINPDRFTRLTIKKVCLNPTRTGFLTVLKKMGAEIRIDHEKYLCGEPVADLVVTPCRLRATHVGGKIVPSLIDEVPILAVAAACAEGKSSFRDMKELRIKETDRIEALIHELPKFGIPMTEYKEGFSIEGEGRLYGAKGDSLGDHRVAMSLAILGTVAPGRTRVNDTDCIKTSLPEFFSLMKSIGVSIKLTS
ncbi:MAG: 3-phosphoshikimate 1-carboxyvinyltransferase [Deltaproteobacteria bacterium]|nr:3-phosphoshikimate 1-carboxyvinyltransferase [Deltaproteobacteria bacterium]